ncbi:TetM/TetW/TetO/TetS family tetracycline resistance ribosomal protection protein [Desulfotomaculum sp. OF05-3]|uniref:translation factor GTPase family protein n=1 Tax=Desulfotomaculum sp. OF05-3 TaxID=2305243 RepID=UPI000E416073|nr:TetM/TetW/TetO/TetS family tetracycline resistance ribosomal protection protein [Desulfotomaculum sp. OF05-3]RGE16327.1 GTP-binding protein [Desulfotomaculum sp. OF05-3]
MKRFVIGILAHVDAGKTTMSEAILYETGKLKKMGRVDNRDAFLDTFALERARGITIFSKQAVFPLGDTFVTLLDTPGHVDFSAEMERTLQVLDYAVLIVSGADGVQGHTETLWRLLKRYRIPVFLFVNKMDQKGTDRDAVLASLKERLDHGVVDFSGVSGNCEILGTSDETAEEIATCDEALLEAYLADGGLKTADVRNAIQDRKLFPCFFGSALKLTGVREFLTSLGEFASCPDYTKDFGAKVFKISRDETGVRMTHLKITGGTLKIRDSLSPDSEEKINQIRLYSGSKFEALKEAEPGMVVAVTGISDTRPGQVFGTASESALPLLEPVLTYRILLPFGTDSHTMLKNMRMLEEEDPQLHIVWNEALGEIQAQVMGDVQMEILKSQVQERFGVEIEFGEGNIVYKETIAKIVEGVGHFEPLRHYAEVHLLMEPGEPGSGLVFEADCSEDMLDRNWQRLILTHLEEKRFRGILTGSEITDMKITLIAGRAHQKHTEGGDFRQATYRAVRQGLCEAGCVLLEPYYAFRLEVPSENLGRAMADLDRMQGEFSAPEQDGSIALLTGTAPVSTMRNYQRDVISYTKGRGRLTLSLSGYEPCHNAEEVIAASGYDFDSDLQDPAGSVFCSHGAGFVVPWDEVKQYMHVESPLAKQLAKEQQERELKEANERLQAMAADVAAGKVPSGAAGGYKSGSDGSAGSGTGSGTGSDDGVGSGTKTSANGTADSSSGSRGNGDSSLSFYDDKELQAIFTRTYGEPKRKLASDYDSRTVIRAKNASPAKPVKEKEEPEDEYLLVDGYNIIFAWEELSDLAAVSIDAARYKLMDILSNYQGFRKICVIVVFDAYKVPGGVEKVQKYHNINVVYTKEAETADQYIEKVAIRIGRRYRTTVATSDGVIQLIIRSQGCILWSARDFREEIERVGKLISEEKGKHTGNAKNYLFAHADAETQKYLEAVRLGKNPEMP